MENENQAVESQSTTKGSDLSLYVTDIFQEFKNGRKEFEIKAEEWWNNFLSQYQSSKAWRNKEGEGNRSRIFIKLTQQKCYTAHAKIMDALGSDVPFEFEAVPNLDYGQIPPELIEEAAQFRKTYIAEYLKYIKYFDTLDDAALDATIFPISIIKGPIITKERKAIPERNMIFGMPAEQLDPRLPAFTIRMQEVEKYEFETVPFWDYYVDVNAKTLAKSIGEIHYKRLLPQEFRELARAPGYDAGQMKAALAEIDNLKSAIPDSDNDHTMKKLGDKFNGFEVIKDGKIPVIEYSGLVPVKKLREFGADVPEEIGDDEDAEGYVTVVLAGANPVIRAQYNHLGYRPAMGFGVKKIPNCVYKNSIAALMDDSQSMVNSGARMYIDNKALSGNGCVALHTDKIDWQRTKDASIYPRKTFYLKGNASVKEAIDSIAFPDVTFGIKDMVEMFMRIADEETGIPKYAHGDASQSFLNRTATGISMIMGAANVNLKPFLKNIDDGAIEPTVERLDNLFSMLGKYPQQYNIPLKVVATGTISMIARELIVENMLKLLQITQNPQDAIIVNRRGIIKAMAEKLGLSKFVKTDAEIQQIERMMAERQAAQPLQAEGQVDVDKLFPMLTPIEQAQVLQSVGLQPDPARLAVASAPQTGMPTPAGPGFHQMPDGSVMANSAMPPAAGGQYGQ